MDRRVRQVLVILETAWCTTVRVRDLAVQIGIGTSRLEYLFKRDAKMSIRQFIRERRLAEAVRMLVWTDESVSIISFSAGFPDISNFNHAFKKKFGVSPLRYRSLSRALDAGSPVIPHYPNDQAVRAQSPVGTVVAV